MTFAADLLEQAFHLAERDRGRPKQASLRRAVSAAYYSVFHLVAADAAARFASLPALRPAVGRAFEHRKIVAAARAIVSVHRSPRQQQWLLAHLCGAVSDRLSQFCGGFVELHQERHIADYDIDAAFTREKALALVNTAEAAHAAWRAERASPNALVFLLVAAGLLADR